MNSRRLYLDIHAIQVLPPSCVNRDDAGTPKSCVYGGKTRARVSSQCWKRAARMYMRNTAPEMVGIRTKKIMSETEKLLEGKYAFSSEDAKKAAENAVKVTGIKSNKKDKNEVLAFFSQEQMEAFAKTIADNKESALKEIKDEEENKNENNSKKKGKKKSKFVEDLEKAITDNPSADILLFGRMFAGNPSLEYDASCQVAHAISVNEARTEYDYFTAVDDIPDENSNGSAYLDTKQYNDPIFYRYANVNLSDTSELIRMDRENAAEVVREFIKAFVLSMPTGSENGYANSTLPDYIMLALRDDMPVSFAPAFIKVVTGDDYEKEAEQKLKAYAEKISKNYGEPIEAKELGDAPFEKMIDDICNKIEERLKDGNAAS